MKIVLLAWCPSSVSYLDALCRAGAAPGLVLSGAGAGPDAPVAVACARRAVPWERVDDVNAPAIVDRIRHQSPDLLLVAGCAQILGRALLEAPRLGALNFHPSLLPHYRGKQPLFWAIFRGESRTGITVHRMTAEVDRGPIVAQCGVGIDERATSASLAAEVDRVGAALLPALLEQACRGSLPEGYVPSEPGSYFPPLRPEHGHIDWTRSPIEIDRWIRAATGEIHTYTWFRGMRLIVLAGRPAGDRDDRGIRPAAGRVLKIDGGAIHVATPEGAFAATRWLFLHRAYSGEALARELSIEIGDSFSGCASTGA